MSEATRRSLSSNRKKRGVVRASMTKLRTRLGELEAVRDADNADQARRRLDTLFEEYKVHHFSVIDLLDSDDELAEEQEVFDTQDEEVTQLALRLERLISSSDTSQSRVAFNRLKRIEKD